jgi:hypothetical protein
MRPSVAVAMAVWFALAFFGGLTTVAFVFVVLVPIWAILTVVRWQQATRRRGPER